MLKKVLIGLAIVLAGALAVAIARFNLSGGDGAALSGQTRADLVRSAVGGCVALQKASPDNAGVEPGVIDAYCECYADALGRRVTTADVDALTGKPPADIQAAMRPKMDESEQACLAKLGDDDAQKQP